MSMDCYSWTLLGHGLLKYLCDTAAVGARDASASINNSFQLLRPRFANRSSAKMMKYLVKEC
jgi:hypothetical protein